jgi:hypothetical protein
MKEITNILLWVSSKLRAHHFIDYRLWVGLFSLWNPEKSHIVEVIFETRKGR